MKKTGFGFVAIAFLIAIIVFSGCTQPPGGGTPTPTLTPTPALAGPQECGTDIDCIIKAAESCSEAKYTSVQKLSLGFIGHTNTSQIELKGMSEGKCLFYLKNEKNEFVFGPEYTQEQKDQVLAMYKKLEGLDMVCKFEKEQIRKRVCFVLASRVEERNLGGIGHFALRGQLCKNP